MSENIIVALIGAGAVIIAAIITLIGNLKKKNVSEKRTKIKQSAKGNSNVQIGIQNNLSNDKGSNRL